MKLLRILAVVLFLAAGIFTICYARNVRKMHQHATRLDGPRCLPPWTHCPVN